MQHHLCLCRLLVGDADVAGTAVAADAVWPGVVVGVVWSGVDVDVVCLGVVVAASVVLSH
jgi:hypothetical protein